MEQVYRRQLLALGKLRGDAASVDACSREFIRGVLAGPLGSRPNSQGVEDVLFGSGAEPAAVARFLAAFDTAVWGTPAK
jgi:hypothetical protein